MEPTDLKYAKTHEWLRAEDKQATVGITDHAQSELGDVVFVELPEIGAKVTAGEKFGAIESVKSVSDLFAPVSGEVVKVNESLPDTPEAVNESPFTDGWLIVINMSNPSELNELMSAEQYETFIQEH